MNLFATQMVMEDIAGIDYPEGQLITEGDEAESVQAAVMEVTEEEAGIEAEERQAETLEADEETLSEVQEAIEVEVPKTEHAGLSQTNMRLLKVITGRVLGKSFNERKLPRMEHFGSRADARDATGLVLEGVGDALKAFWEALKAQFKKIWAKVKTWAIKTFSAAKKIHDRAKTIRDRAESSSATIDKKSFQFGQVKQLAVDGRLKEVNKFESALNTLVGLVSATTEVQSDKALETLETTLDAIADRKSETNTRTELLARSAVGAFDRIAVKSAEQIADPKVLSSLGGGEDGDADPKSTETLPGDKVLVVIQAKNASNPVKALRMTRVTFANTKNKPREISGDAEATTLNPSQIAKFCDAIASSAGDIADFEAKWQKTDKAQEAVLRRIDEVVRDGVQDNKDDDEGTNTKERDIRTLASAATNFVKRVGGIPAQVAGFAIPVYAATLNWCEGSMRNYKK